MGTLVARTRTLAWWSAIAGCLGLWLAAAPAAAQVAAGYSEYYIPGDEDDIGLVLCAFGTGGNACPAGYHTHTVITVTAWSDNTTIYYDQWENGYNFDPANPGATSDETYTLNTGQRMAFESGNISLPRTATPPTGSTCTNYRNGTVVASPASPTCYDGRDHLYVAGGTVTVTRVGWIEERGVGVQGVAWEIYPVKPQLTTYVVPFGETSGWHPFGHEAALIQATRNNTVVTIDLNHDGTPEWLDTNRDGTVDATSVTLQAGQTFLLDDTSAHVAAGALAAGAVITGTDTLQVKYIAGMPSDNYSTRGFSAFPRGLWTTDYYAPLDQPTNAAANGNTDYYLYNPNSAAITVTWSSSAGSGSFNILATSAVSFRTATGGTVPVDSGLYLKGSDIFWGVGVNDADGQAHEWGYSLLPSTMLYTEHFLGWAPDCLPSAAGCATDMGAFLTVAQDNTRVFVDLNNDGVVDQTYTLNRLQTQFIDDPNDGDLSGARIWATGPFSMAYGQNSNAGVTAAPALDLGYVAIPGTDFISLVLSVSKSASPQVVPTASGSSTTFTIKVNSQKYTVDGVTVADTLPASWAITAGTTTIIRPDLTTISGVAAEPTVAGQILTWSAAQTGGGMDLNQQITITFTAHTTAVLATGTLSQNRVQAVGTRTVGGVTQTFTATDFAYVISEGTAGTTVQIAKTSSVGPTTPVYPGDTITYTTTVTNPAGSGTTLTGVTLYDPLPGGVTYVPGSGSVTCEIAPRNVRDEFATAAYTNNGPNNTDNWASNWTETDLYGTGATGATGGLVWITGGVLQFRYLLATVLDQFNTNGIYTENDGTNNWAAAWTETADEGTAGAGSIRVTGNHIRFRPGTAGRAVSRTATVTGATSATINFALTDVSIVAGDTVVAEYSLDGGAFVTIGTLDGGTGWSGAALPFTIPLNNNNTLTLQFRAPLAWGGTREADVDNVQISFVPIVGAQIQRTADLTGANNPVLSFTYASAGLGAGDTFVVEASSSAAGPFTTLATFVGGTPSAAPPYDLSAYASANTTIRFRVTGGFNSAGKTLSIDNADITYSVTTTASSDPPNFLGSASGCLVRPGGTPVTMTFRVTVDNPLPTGLTSITNTASTTSTQLPFQVSASVTNIVSNPSTQSASVAGRVWLDSNANGVQDIGEPGISNVEVTLKDQYGTSVATATTDANGRYQFAGVRPGNGYYVEATGGLPSGVTQTFPAGYSNNHTTPFNLVDGQTYSTADLGYRPAAGTVMFGDLVWVDANGNGVRDSGEVGLGGVTVLLYSDTNGNGRYDEGTDTLVATTTSAADGSYSFTGIAAGSTYFVIARTPLDGSNNPYYNPTTAMTYRFSSVTAGSAYLTADFGFQPNGTTMIRYNISDRVWFDLNGNGAFDSASETGIAGVTVALLDASSRVIATTTTAADGTFTFSGVAGAGADYTVRITDTSGILTNYTGTTSYALARQRAESNVTADIDRRSAPSYGFRPTRSIGDTIFHDLNGNGVQDAGETGIAGIVVGLYNDANGNGVINAGDNLIGTVTTDANGKYYFSGLTNANYIVSVPTLSGYNFTGPGTDSDSGTAGTQKGATIAGGNDVWTVDFGFQAPTPRSVGGTVWNDSDADGVIDSGETAIAGVTLNVLSGTTVVATVTTDSSGAYSVDGLASGTYTVQLTDTSGVLTGDTSTYEKTEGTTAPFNYQETVNLSTDVTNVNFGFAPAQVTFAAIAYLKAYLSNGSVMVEWRTSLEVGTVGFHLSRLNPASGRYRRLDEKLLPALLGQPQGGTYRFQDDGAPTEGTLTYKLVEVDVHGRPRAYGPYTVAVDSAGSDAALEAQGEMNGAAFHRRPASVSRSGMARLTARAVERRAAALNRLGRQSAALKITTKEAGLYYVGAAQIAGPLGLSTPAVSALLRSGRLALSQRGQAVPYLPDGRSTGIYFYAEPIRSIYTDENVYQVSSGPALPMAAIASTRATASVTSFQESVHREEDQYAVPVVFQDPEADFWIWAFLLAGYDEWDTKSVTVPAPGVAGSGGASLTVHLVGATDSAAELDHHVAISFNGTLVGEDTWGGIGRHDIEIPLGSSAVLEGDNTVEIKAELGDGVPESMVLLDSIDLSYARRYRTAQDQLTFTAPGGTAVEVAGFSSANVLLLEVTQPARPALVVNYSTLRTADGSYAVRLGTPADSATHRYAALASPLAKAPIEVAAWRSAGLRDRSNRAKYVLIAPDALEDAAGTLASYRNERGISTMVVGLDAIYNEFNSGIEEPTAIREFLRYASSRWATPPRYVALIGRGTWDYKNVLGLGDNLVPPLLAASADGLFASDVRLADLAGDDGVPEVAIGRIPVLTSQELLDYVAKIRSQESVGPAAWNRNILMAADNPDGAGAFTADSDAVAALLPRSRVAQKVYLATTPPDVARQQVVDALNSGVALFNYIGHGGFDRLADENLLTSADVPSLGNAGRLPVFLAMTCSVGDFAMPGYPSLAETMLLQKDGGALAVWAPSGLSQNDLAVRLNKSFFTSAFVRGDKVIGDIVVRGLEDLDAPGSAPMRYMYNLLGEPVSRVPQ